MGRATDSREVLIAEALGDFQLLLERIDALAPKLEATSDRIERSAKVLCASIEPLRQRLASAVAAERDSAIARFGVEAAAAAAQAHRQQLEAMKASAREIFQGELLVAVSRLETALQRTEQQVRHGRQWWLSHAATAFLLATSAALLVVTIWLPRDPPPTAQFSAGLKDHAPAIQASDRARVRP